ncbi:hypothetical protein [Dyadobacter sp. CY351]|uniref:hypothetical protein n=1 Tax=Dyadobacter sp. CY351 TaxID=2909337 RepID=UPI001F38FD28|nr:hypothetical protein [Dyadobacter sp. CY351]MCF2516037.1 hypothetical protein [Dyadobacter sp. CY351]
MARIKDVTKECFKALYSFIETEFFDNREMMEELSRRAFNAERNVMLELIKREAVEKVLTERVILYSTDDVSDELTGSA